MAHSAAYNEGYNACYDGLCMEDNPFSWNSGNEALDFEEGYEAALREIEADCSNAEVDAEIDAATYD